MYGTCACTSIFSTSHFARFIAYMYTRPMSETSGRMSNCLFTDPFLILHYDWIFRDMGSMGANDLRKLPETVVL